jgi:hypothetical protein
MTEPTPPAGRRGRPRSWRTRSQLELAIVEYISWFNDSRLHENLDDQTPKEIEELYAAKHRPTITTS